MAGENWAERVKNKMNETPEKEKEMEDWKKRSIYKLPTSITDLNKKAYIPQEVSFGPYHHGEDHLRPMEEHKERALLHFLRRSNKPLQFLINSLEEVVEDLKSSYAMLPERLHDDEFIMLMILDGCFMLEILHSYEVPPEDYAYDDPIFSRNGTIRWNPRLRRDMLMLENQLPMLVLEKLSAIEGEQEGDEYLNNLILNFTAWDTTEEPLGKCLHVLDVYRKKLLTNKNKGKNLLRGEHQGGDERNVIEPPALGKCLLVLQDVYRKNLLPGGGEGSDTSVPNIPSATELNFAGIQFRKSETKSLEDISFNRGTLKLPPIVVEDSTESMFLNLIAYERYHIGTGNREITSYIYFMDYVIDTEKDVALLKSRKIVQNLMGSDKDVAELFNSLAKDIALDPDCKLNEVLDNVQKQYDKPWIACRTNLSHLVESFRHRWAFLSLVAAIFLFTLATTQTVYTVGAYYKNDSPPKPPAVPPPPPPVISRRYSSYRHP